jgi:hypothetical protein
MDNRGRRYSRLAATDRVSNDAVFARAVMDK